MLSKPTDSPTPLLKSEKEQIEGMLGMQKELLDAYEQSSRAWLARVKSEVDFWSEMATKLAGTRSVPDVLGAYQERIAQRMQMAAEDGRRLSDECQKFMQTMTRSLSNGWPTASK